jgi:hypothetical protein
MSDTLRQKYRELNTGPHRHAMNWAVGQALETLGGEVVEVNDLTPDDAYLDEPEVLPEPSPKPEPDKQMVLFKE